MLKSHFDCFCLVQKGGGKLPKICPEAKIYIHELGERWIVFVCRQKGPFCPKSLKLANSLHSEHFRLHS